MDYVKSFDFPFQQILKKLVQTVAACLHFTHIHPAFQPWPMHSLSLPINNQLIDN